MLEYNLLMSIMGPLVLAGIILMWDLTRKVEKLRLGTRRLSFLILIGGILTAVGFITYSRSVDHTWEAFLVMFGPVLIAYSLSESGLVQPKLEMLAQVAIMLGSIGISAHKAFYTMLMFSALSILLMIDAVAFYRYVPQPYGKIARLSAWLFVAFTVVNAISYGSPLAFAIYFLSIVLWIGTLICLELYLSRIDVDRCGQKAL
ncbi:hypothetical protein [Thermococcus sp. AM4]|uniref:hypothetical protein n=1 Tax=Thermococcus sp. (strain AM4) TaxID=246969 RepID=UPI00018709AC|nr:hypothetical protein [Thermococcus sp. AM4]